jgi:acetolactate synthase I/II/III large subunit
VTTVGQALVAGLAARGVEVVFGIPGVHTIELYRGLSGSGVRHVTARHEQGAAFMADGYARVSGRPGVAFVITGPGLTNALTAMAQARADSVPVLIVSGVNRRDSLGRGLGHLHELPNQAGLVAALCPTFRVSDPQALDGVLDAAFAALTTGRPGPVHVEVPTDVMALPCAAPAAPPMPPVPALPDLAAAARRLAASTRPVILAGGGARRAGAALQALAERLDAPVILTTNARGLMHAHPLVVPASASLDAVRALIAGAGQVLAVGTELGQTDYDMYVRGGLPDLSGMIRIDTCQAQLSRHPAALALQAEAGRALAALLPLVPQARQDGAARAAATRATARAELSAPMQAQLALLEVLRDAVPGAIIVGDSTQPVYAGNLFYDHDRPGGWFNAATGYGALGYGPGAAVGAALAAPGTPVICLIGDGGLQFSPGELRTAVDEGLPVTFLVWNNAGFREIAENMRDAGIEVIGCAPSPLNMAPFAAACDLPFASITPDADALRAALSARGPGPNLIEIRVP